MATRDPDDLVAGRYRLGESDDGSDSVVRIWQAHDVLLDRAVVAKEVTGRREQGLAEARVLARFNRVLDVVEEPGRVWIITNLGEAPPHAIGVARVNPGGAPAEVARRRRPRALIVATATLAVAAAGGGIALAATRGGGTTPEAGRSAPATGRSASAAAPVMTTPVPRVSSSAPVTVPQATFAACGMGAPQGVMHGTSTARLVPAGYVWHHDFAKFGFDVPDGWIRQRTNGTYCFRDPAGGRGFVVTKVSGAPAPAAYWQTEERTRGKALPSYHRISLGADGWEYTWKPADGTVRHGLEVLFAPSKADVWAIQWIGGDAQWSSDQEIRQQVIKSFDVDPSALR
jgi:hypothetical protein